VNELDELRTLVREVIRDLMPNGIRDMPGGLPVTETVNLSTDADLAAFVSRLLDLDPDEREHLQTGQKRFRLATTSTSTPAPAAPGPAAPGPASAVRRIERGAVTERTVEAAARAGERLVLGRGAVLTPLARDRARSGGVEIERER
jgi:hypothetical protein